MVAILYADLLAHFGDGIILLVLKGADDIHAVILFEVAVAQPYLQVICKIYLIHAMCVEQTDYDHKKIPNFSLSEKSGT